MGSSAPSGLQGLLSLGAAVAGCVLFGVTYRYAVRQDADNLQVRGCVWQQPIQNRLYWLSQWCGSAQAGMLRTSAVARDASPQGTVNCWSCCLHTLRLMLLCCFTTYRVCAVMPCSCVLVLWPPLRWSRHWELQTWCSTQLTQVGSTRQYRIQLDVDCVRLATLALNQFNLLLIRACVYALLFVCRGCLQCERAGDVCAVCSTEHAGVWVCSSSTRDSFQQRNCQAHGRQRKLVGCGVCGGVGADVVLCTVQDVIGRCAL